MRPPMQPRVVGRYALHDELAAGGMAAVHIGLLLGAKAFARPVAIKRPHPHLARDPAFVAMFLDEARLAARVRHPNVVPTLDVVEADGEVLLVMEYVAGESLNRLLRSASGRGEPVPPAVIAAVLVGVLDGLHAAHEARDARGEPLGLVHRDVSPHNVMVTTDGVARVLDFGIAKAAGRLQTTREGQVKGKLGYMAPEQIERAATRASDVYSAGVCLWELVALRRLFDADDPSVIVARVLAGVVDPPGAHAPALGAIAMRALSREPAERFPTAHAMARAVEAAVAPAPPWAVAAWLESLEGPRLLERAARVAEIEGSAPALPAAAPALPAAAPPTRRRAPWGLALGAALSLAVAGVAVARSRTPASPVLTSTIASAPAVVPSASADPPATAAPTPTEEARSPSAAPPAKPPRALVAAPRAAPAKTEPCDPPYTVDADGVRHYKRACFR